ncbi:MAG: hypothetical protein HC847_13605 [Hydrococcus sp. RU_2_2]|jgi:hypothetical protein|nr:hypothetical protein [Hydrococcus sp. RU_2_2]NJP19512.1 hypothetical protein [Hydrococcus sp. CRU_1_1]
MIKHGAVAQGDRHVHSLLSSDDYPGSLFQKDVPVLLILLHEPPTDVAGNL